MTLSCRAFVAIVAVVFVAGCAGGSSSVTPAGPLTRLLPGAATLSGPRGWPDAAKKKKKKPILFVADLYANVVRLYDPSIPNPPQEGSITDGVDDPTGLAVDSKGSLCVSNVGGSPAITVYAPGESKPHLRIPTPGYYAIAIDSKGDIFATGSGPTVYGYKPGAKKPYEMIGGFNYPISLAVDSKNNVWVSDELANKVYVIAAGTTHAKDAGLMGVNVPLGISVGPKNVMYLANFSPLSVKVYPAGSKKASATITDGITGPTLNGVTAAGIFFQGNFGSVVGYRNGQRKPFSTIISGAVGVASSPLVKK